MRFLIVALVAVGCGSSEPASPAAPSRPTAGVKRLPELDQHCDPGHPHALDYSDQEKAEAAGCTTVRVYGAVKDNKTGEMHDNEVWVFCCPKS